MPNKQRKKVLLATDVPFWECLDGAQRRIDQLVRVLIKSGFRVQVFFLGEAIDVDPEEFEFELEVASSAVPPRDLAPRLKWYFEAAMNQWRPHSKLPDQDATSQPPLRLKDFEWPWVKQKFAESFRRFQPDVLIVEYVKLVYLVNSLTRGERQACCCCIDTHDILHRRAKQFRERGEVHWIELTEAEEIKALGQFDVVFAIQKTEAAYFRERLHACGQHQTSVWVVGFASEFPDYSPPSRFVDSVGATFGYIGSANPSNLDACQALLAGLWPRIKAQLPESELVIAGSVCDLLMTKQDGPCGGSPGLNLLGRVNQVAEFYQRIDIALNPVRFGTGLKIKNAEALAHGRPLVTTPNGWDGIHIEWEGTQPVLVASNDEEFIEGAVRWARDEEQFRQRVQASIKISDREFSEVHVYSELRSGLDSYNR